MKKNKTRMKKQSSNHKKIYILWPALTNFEFSQNQKIKENQKKLSKHHAEIDLILSFLICYTN